MSFVKLLHGIGDKLGILEAVPAADSTPARRIQTRVVSLKELASEINSGEVRALADSLSELSIPFQEIYLAAGISSDAEEWTMDRLKQVISEETGKEKSREAVQKAVLDLLHSKGVSAEALIKDAMARDQALDAFETRAAEKLRERSQACKKKVLELEAQIKSVQEEVNRIESSLKADEAKWSEWKRHKRSHERELASAASYIVDRPVITTDEED